ncbi:hypothetical protein [Salinispora pacifica]|uniref:hypothetical protein n=1 Tax=Salinispora pacifica TaxID=351187 RepID=UPI000487A365|nr:hypothetical protein [Salinispora pacifica]
MGSGTLVCHPNLLAFIKDRLKFSADWHPPRAEAISQLDDGLIRVRLARLGVASRAAAAVVAHEAGIAVSPPAQQ